MPLISDQKQSPRGVLRKSYSENMQQSNFIKIALRHGCSPINLLHIFRTPFPKNTPGSLLLNDGFYKIFHVCRSGNTVSDSSYNF